MNFDKGFCLIDKVRSRKKRKKRGECKPAIYLIFLVKKGIVLELLL